MAEATTKRSDPTNLTARECLGLVLPPLGVLIFILGWCDLMLESGHASRDPIHETGVFGARERYATPTNKTLTRQSAIATSIWLFAGTAVTVLGLLCARKQFTLYILLFIAAMVGASGALPYIFLKH